MERGAATRGGTVRNMSADWEAGGLLQPIRDDSPCGENLDDTPVLGMFDAYQLFGQTTLEPEPAIPGQPVPKNPVKNRPPDWADIKGKALEALQKSKDLRLLAHLGTAVLRTDGLPAFARTVGVASHWLDSYWDQTYPLVDSDGIPRQSALNCFCDPVAVVDGLRRTPLVDNRRLGRFSLRDVEIASGTLQPTDSESRPSSAQIDAAFDEMPLVELQALAASVKEASEALRRIDHKMRDEVGNEAAPSFEALWGQLTKVGQVVQQQLGRRPDAAAALDSPAGEGAPLAAPAASIGAISSRADAIRALDAVSLFFQKTEPSSPVPLLLARAKGLVSKTFIEILADLAPSALEQVRAVGGIKDGE